MVINRPIPGQPPGPTSAAAFMREVLRRITWRAVLITQLLGFLFALSDWLESLARPHPLYLPYEVDKQSVAALLVMVAAYVDDEAVRGGRSVLMSFAAVLLCTCTAAALVQYGMKCWLLAPEHRNPDVSQLVNDFFDVGGRWGTALLAYLNRQSVERILARLRASELARRTAEHGLIDSHLAATGTELDLALVLRKLAELRRLYAAGDADADRAFEHLSEDLRNRVARAAAAVERLPPPAGAAACAGRPGSAG